MFTFSDTFHFPKLDIASLTNLGNRVAVMLPNCPDAITLYEHLYEADKVAILVPPTTPPELLAFIMNDSQVDTLVSDKGCQRITIQDSPNIPGVNTIIYTSGTTGNPKGVMLGMKQWLANADAVIEHHQLDETTIHATPLPLYHVNAHGFSFLAMREAGCQSIFFERRTPDILDEVNTRGVHILNLVPSIINKFLAIYPNWRPHKDFRYILSAAAPLSNMTKKLCRDVWGVEIVQGYGCSESTNFTTTMPLDSCPDELNQPIPSIGITLKDTTIFVGSTDQPLTEGELFIKAPSNSPGYIGNPIRTEEFIASGDIGFYQVYEGRRYYYISGRTKEMINRGGETIAPRMVEMLIPQPCVALAIPDGFMDNEIGLVITSRNVPDVSHLPRNLQPKTIYYTDELPYTTTGKIQRGKIDTSTLEVLWTIK